MGNARKYGLSLFLLPFLMAAGCSRFIPDSSPGADGLFQKGFVRLKVDNICAIPIMRSITMAFDEDGIMMQKDSSRAMEWKMRCGTYNIRCAVNFPSKMTETIWECSDSVSLFSNILSIEDIAPGQVPAILNIGGRDERISLNHGEHYEISLCGRSTMARIHIREICNLTSEENMPGSGPCRIRCLSATLINVPSRATLGGRMIPPLSNSTGTRQIDLGCVCVRQEGSSTWIEEGQGVLEDISLYCFSNSGSEGEPLIVSVAMEIDGETYWYNIPLGEVAQGYEYAINKLSIMKKGSTNPFDVTNTSAFTVSTIAEEWSSGEESGLAGTKPFGEPDYILSDCRLGLSAPGNSATLNFNTIYGRTCVSSSDDSVISVLGAGKTWSLHALSEGYAQLNMNDGHNSMSIPLCAGASIRYKWMDTEGKVLDDESSIYLYQRCRLAVEKWYGTLDMDVGSGGFELDESKSGSYGLHPVYTAGTPGVNLCDYFENTSAVFPGKIVGWDLSQCPLSVNTDDGNISCDESITASLTLPFDIKDMSPAPKIFVFDPNGNMFKYGIFLSSVSNGRIFTVTASTLYSGRSGKLNISVNCEAGGMSRELFKITTCRIVLL